MAVPGSLLQTTIRKTRAAYEIDQSIRFNRDDDAKLTRTFGTATNRRIYTLSTWEKNAKSAGSLIEYNATGGVTWANITFGQDGRIDFFDYSGGAARIDLRSSAIYRDPSAWYHVVVAVDTTQATSTDRIKMYVNGVQITSFGTATYPSQNFDGFINSAVSHLIGDGVNGPFDGYLAEYHFIDGQALDPTSFGETNSDGVWIPKAYEGTYGTNGFYITGENSADLGADYSGNSNDFTSSGLTGADQITGDTPTTNACVMSPIDQYGSTLNLADGNLRCTPSTSSYCSAHGTFYVSSGKWVIECKHTTVFGEGIGFAQNGQLISGSSHRGFGMFADGRKFVNTTYTATGTGLASGDYRYCFLDLDNNAMWFAHCDVSSGTPTTLVYENGATKSEIEAGTTTNAVHTSLPAGYYAPTVWMDTSGVIEMNFGQSAFYTSSDLPEGFKALNTANLDNPTIADPSAHVGTLLWSGDGTSPRNISGLSFQPGLSWIKNRTGAFNHNLSDQVRGGGKTLFPSSTSAEQTNYSEGYISAFNSDGIQTTNGTSSGHVNDPSYTYVAWNWKANGTGSSNTDGSITSTVSVNQTAGFSIVSYIGNSTSGATVGHGLGAVPKMMILKDRDVAENWCIYHDVLGPTKFMFFTTDAAFTVSNRWNDTAPTSSVFTLGNETQVNATGRDYVVYCFAEVEGFSKIGSYTGNGSTDGPFVYTGFKPAFIMTKRTDSTGDWTMVDSERSPYNLVENAVFANLFSTEDTTGDRMDILSNGFKLRTTAQPNVGTLVYMAFAEYPFGGAGVAPVTAR